ncbi:MAG: hypothetical protein GC186_18430 [Rhodobacteraceae bacterium]|nr:hypothetical protein [Paracoccaceae bacterium]
MWQEHLQEGERLLWADQQSVGGSFHRSATGIGLFGACAAVFGWVIVRATSEQAYCGPGNNHYCAEIYAMRWPGLVACMVFVAIAVLMFFLRLTGLMVMHFALTDRRAMKLLTRWRGKYLAVDRQGFALEYSWLGGLRFGDRRSPVFTMDGLTRAQAERAMRCVYDSQDARNTNR